MSKNEIKRRLDIIANVIFKMGKSLSLPLHPPPHPTIPTIPGGGLYYGLDLCVADGWLLQVLWTFLRVSENIRAAVAVNFP